MIDPNNYWDLELRYTDSVLDSFVILVGNQGEYTIIVLIFGFKSIVRVYNKDAIVVEGLDVDTFILL